MINSFLEEEKRLGHNNEEGTLLIKVLEGRLVRDTETLGTMDPYITIEYQGMEFKTQTIKGGGKRPTFNETFEIEVYRVSDEIKFACFDDDILINDVVGEKSFPVRNLCQAKLVKKVVPLEFEGSRVGDLVIETKFTAKGVNDLSKAQKEQSLR